MASRRVRTGVRTMSEDDSRGKRMGGVMEPSREELSSSLSRIPRQDSRKPQLGSTSTLTNKPQSRIPQNPSSRKPANTPTSRPPLTHETQAWSSPKSGSHRFIPIGVDNAPLPTPARDRELSQPRNASRRTQPGVSQETDSLRNNPRARSGRSASTSSIPHPQQPGESRGPLLDRSVTTSPVEFQVASRIDPSKAVVEAPTVYPELDRYRDIQIPRDAMGTEILFRLATHDLPPPTPLFSGASSHSQMSTFSGSPSTRFSESPGPGPYSRDTTPTSMSSASPNLVAPLRSAGSRGRQPSPANTRPPVTRRRTGSISTDNDSFGADPHGLAAVRETLTSSSSSSTVRDAEKDKKTKSPPPPNPPPRKSSQKFKKGRARDESPTKLSKKPATPVMRSPSPVKSPPPARGRAETVSSPQARTPPSRPSRDGTPDLYSHFGGPVPVIQSNLSSTSLSERRQSGQLAPNSLPRSTTPLSKDRSMQSKLPVNREPTPAPRSASSAAPPSKPSRTPSPNVSTFRSRFGIFGRRKTETDVSVDKKEKPPRKGPAAGTGHEGYGRIGAVRRRSSNAVNLPRGPPGLSPSSDSLASLHSNDPFLLARLNPVVIAGGEIVENRNENNDLSRTESNQSFSQAGASIDSRNASTASLASPEGSRHTLWPSPFPRESTRSRRPSDSSDSEAVTMKSTLAFRRSVQRLNSSPDQQPMKLPKPIVTKGITSASTGSLDTTIFTDDSVATFETGPRKGVEAATTSKKLTKRAKSPRRWNLFGRSHHSKPKAQEKAEPPAVTAAVKIAPDKPVAFYAIMDSPELGDSGEQDVGDILRQAKVLAPTTTVQGPRPPLNKQPTKDNALPKEVPRAKPAAASMAPRTKPAAAAMAPRCKPPAAAMPVRAQPAPQPGTSNLGMAQDSDKTSPARPSRLPQVGRIPKVVNTRPEQTSPKSFSRPFNRVSLQFPPPSLAEIDLQSVAKGPSPPRSNTPEFSRSGSSVTTIATNSPPVPLKHRKSRSLDVGRSDREFLAFSTRTNSGATTSSSSSTSGTAGFSNHTAVVPAPTAPLAEDEIWDEYNDLLGDVPPSATSSKGAPFHLESYEARLLKKEDKAIESPTIIVQRSKDIRDSTDTGKADTSSSHYSSDMAARINAAFRFDADTPPTPFSVTDFVSGYGARNNSADISKALAVAASRSSRSSSCSVKSRRTRESNSSSASEETPLSQVNLRVGSMTVSKWLTFGHVLFSPVRDELIPVVGSLKRHSILVVDGLGNDDWSFYAAETYPAATFFNLSPRAPLPKEHRTSTQFPPSPPNHHQIQYLSHLDKFPFSPESFNTVVFRFAAAAPEAHYRNIISEARRVLKPGGYIELSILDVDLNNMGNRARRAVRRLKERVNIQHPNVNLSSTADLMLRLLAKKRFIDVKNCRVGVPVASAITKPAVTEGGKRKKDERSLAEMMDDETESGDENITRMVAKVGRWWYNRLYEVPMGMTNSIWNDRALLAECEEWKTSLKLMVCYAKVPETRSRVSSI